MQVTVSKTAIETLSRSVMRAIAKNCGNCKVADIEGILQVKFPEEKIPNFLIFLELIMPTMSVRSNK